MTDPKTSDNNDNLPIKQQLPMNGELNSILDAILKGKSDTKADKFYLCRFFGIPVTESAQISEYNLNYAYQLDKKLRNNSDIQAHILEITRDAPDNYRRLAQLNLYKVAAIEGQALEILMNDAQQAIDKPGFIKQYKQTAGVLADDSAGPGQTVINVDKLQIINKQRLEG